MTTPCVGQITYGESLTVPGLTDTVNVVLPLVTSAKMTEKAKYSENSNHIRDWENILEVEAIIYDMSEALDIEFYVKAIKRTLERPGLNLRIQYQGVGHEDDWINPNTCLRGGPYPQEVIVQPFAGNQSIYVKWTVAFYTHQGSCSSLSLSDNQIIDNAFEFGWEISDEGSVAMTLEGYVTFRAPLSGFAFNHVFESMMNGFPFKMTTAYYHALGYELHISKTLSSDKRTIKYKLGFNERETNNALFPYTNMMEIDHEVEGSLMGDTMFGASGFRVWNGSISGTIVLRPRVHKAWALVIFRRIILQRLDRLRLMTSSIDVPDSDTQNGTTSSAIIGKFMPLRFKMRESLYSRSSYFEFEYVFTSDLDTILSHSNMFTRVNTAYTFNKTVDPPTWDWHPYSDATNETKRVPADIDEQWFLHRHVTLPIGSNGIYEYELVDVGNVRFSPCTPPSNTSHLPWVGYLHEGVVPLGYLDDDDYDDPLGQIRKLNYDDPYETFSEVSPGTEDTNDILGSNVTPRNSWINYNQEFEIEEDTGAVPVRYMEPYALAYSTTNEGEVAAMSTPTVEKFTAGKALNISGLTNPPKTIVRRPSSFTIVMRGSALRMKYPVPCPAVISIAGKAAYRIGKPRWSQSNIAVGSDHPVYLAMWEIRYTMDGSPADYPLETLKTTGTPGAYT